MNENLIQQIKQAGQELIDRAEEMVSENTDFVQNFSIRIYFGNYTDRPNIPEITWETSVTCRNSLKAFFEK